MSASIDTFADNSRPRTAKGRATRQRIVDAAARLMLAGGVARTTLDDVGAAAGVGKSQMYHYFRDKADLVDAVIGFQTHEVLGGQEPFLSKLNSWEAWSDWRDHIVAHQGRQGCLGGCPLGSLASELSDTSESARRALIVGFDSWENRLQEGIAAMRTAGLIRCDADPARLATAVLAALQGGLLLCQLRRHTAPLEISLDAALAQLRSYGA